MTTSRTYRSARPMSAALEEISRCAGTHFDPELAKVITSIDRRTLQGIVGLHVFSAPATLPPHAASSPEASLARIHPEFTRRTA
jgi:HD-GYP domain-containing protein (c-di-GMP phosphodiesterase class II)